MLAGLFLPIDLTAITEVNIQHMMTMTVSMKSVNMKDDITRKTTGTDAITNVKRENNNCSEKRSESGRKKIKA